jgi:hypothetical protein
VWTLAEDIRETDEQEDRQQREQDAANPDPVSDPIEVAMPLQDDLVRDVGHADSFAL